jgi:hypothetical protein
MKYVLTSRLGPLSAPKDKSARKPSPSYYGDDESHRCPSRAVHRKERSYDRVFLSVRVAASRSDICPTERSGQKTKKDLFVEVETPAALSAVLLCRLACMQNMFAE